MLKRDPLALHYALKRAFPHVYPKLDDREDAELGNALRWDLDQRCDDLDPEGKMGAHELVTKAAADLSRDLGTESALEPYAHVILPSYRKALAKFNDRVNSIVSIVLGSGTEGDAECP